MRIFALDMRQYLWDYPIRKEYMAKMTKYQLEHFRNKVKRNLNPLIEEQELLVKQFTTEATTKQVRNLQSK